MRSSQTPSSNAVYHLSGGTEANDLHVRKGQHAGPEGLVAPGDPCYHLPYVASVWVPDDVERASIAAGANLELVIIGGGIPPLMLRATSEQPLEREPRPDLDDRSIWLRIHEALAQDLVAVLSRLEGQAADAEARGDGLTDSMAGIRDRLARLRRELELGVEQLREAQAETYPARIRAGEVDPWVGAGAEGCRRSADVVDDELGTLAEEDPRRPDLIAQRDAWLHRADVLEEQDAQRDAQAEEPSDDA